MGTEVKELTLLENLDPIGVFQKDGLNQIVQRITKESRSIVFDMTTPSGRKQIASIANKIARSKTTLDDLGKALVSQWKTKAKVVDAERKSMRDTLDDLKAEIRKPLTDFEDKEKLRIRDHERAILEILDLSNFLLDPDSEAINSRMEDFENLDPREWEEFQEKAKLAAASTHKVLSGLLKRALEREAKEKELNRLQALERERLQAQRDERIRKEAKKEAETKAKKKIEKAQSEKKSAEEKATRLEKQNAERVMEEVTDIEAKDAEVDELKHQIDCFEDLHHYCLEMFQEVKKAKNLAGAIELANQAVNHMET